MFHSICYSSVSGFVMKDNFNASNFLCRILLKSSIRSSSLRQHMSILKREKAVNLFEFFPLNLSILPCKKLYDCGKVIESRKIDITRLNVTRIVIQRKYRPRSKLIDKECFVSLKSTLNFLFETKCDYQLIVCFFHEVLLISCHKSYR